MSGRFKALSSICGEPPKKKAKKKERLRNMYFS
jgi:hypothetical protein